MIRQVCKYTQVEFTKARIYMKMVTQLCVDGGITDDLNNFNPFAFSKCLSVY